MNAHCEAHPCCLYIRNADDEFKRHDLNLNAMDTSL